MNGTLSPNSAATEPNPESDDQPEPSTAPEPQGAPQRRTDGHTYDPLAGWDAGRSGQPSS